MDSFRYISMLFILFLPFYIQNSLAQSPDNKAEIISKYSYEEYDQFINNLYKEIQSSEYNNLNDRVIFISKYFLGKPYILYPLGEGKHAEFDQQPLYRTDGFDCLTYVETVIALTHSSNLNEFKENMLAIRYHRGIPNFIHRNHFTSTDWNINNIKNGYIEDITTSIKDNKGNPIAKISETNIDKPNWYRHHTSLRIKYLTEISSYKQHQLLSRLHKLANQVEIAKSVVAYLPLSLLFNNNGKPNSTYFEQIPDIAIVEIVRPNWELQDQIGTNLQISHLGFVIRDNKGTLIYREASSIEGKVIDIPLTEYLSHYLDSPTVKGISVYALKSAH